MISAEALLGLINNILDIAKIEAGRVEVSPVRFDIGDLLEVCRATVHPLLQPGVELNLVIEPGIPMMETDRDRLKQILLNLLSNAAKFTHAGQINLQAYCLGEDQLLVEVQDTGIGIHEDKLESIFEEFQQADSSTTRKYGGTGLGLTISLRLARLLGGDLSACSDYGEGSTFTLCLPIHYRKQFTEE
jgi:signal transduction histidine kinase